MPTRVRLSDLVEALEMQIDELSSFLDLDTGQVETVSQDLLRKAEEFDDGEDPDLPAWQIEEWELAKRIVSTERFQSLPTSSDIDQWSMMQEFASAFEREQVRQELLGAIHGRGAFRRFKDAIRRHGVEEAWFNFRTEGLRRIAIEWCEENNIDHE
jgi:hypothetical protein